MAVVIQVDMETRSVSRRIHERIVRDSLRAAATNHIEKIVPLHFETSAVRRYGYAPRKKGYMIMKARKYGHQRPLVKTGQLQATIANTSRVTATQHKSTAHLYAYFPLVPERRKELEAMDVSDRKAASDVARGYYRAEAIKPENMPKRKLRIT